MSSTITADQTSAMRPLADVECDHVSGGSPVLAFVGAGLVTWGILYTATHGTMGDGVRAALEAKGLR